MALYPTPTSGEICIAIGQREQGMKMIRQDHNRVDCKRALTTGFTKSGAERIDIVYQRR